VLTLLHKYILVANVPGKVVHGTTATVQVVIVAIAMPLVVYPLLYGIMDPAGNTKKNEK